MGGCFAWCWSTTTRSSAAASARCSRPPTASSSAPRRPRRARRSTSPSGRCRTSPQEERILSLIAAGRTNRQIGEELHLAEKTVKNYVSSVLTKLEVARRAEAAAYLARHGEPRR